MLCLVIFVVGCVVQAFGMLNDRIVGGDITTIEAFPYQLSLQKSESHICGASLITANMALTAAHCTNGNSANVLRLRAGSTNRGFGGTICQISNICQHPLYDSNKIDFDVSVLTLTSALPFSNQTQTIRLQPINIEVPVAGQAVVSGWGATLEGGAFPSALRQVSVMRVSDITCQTAYGAGKITSQMICFGGGGRDSCQGDSGGPINYQGKQVGIVSWGIGCARPNYPGVYTKISSSSIATFIQQCISG